MARHPGGHDLSVTERNAALLAWYRDHGRDLPWRRSTDPYEILVSEVMLQQTQVSRVIPHYHRFLERFPTPGVLAAASRAEVLAAWTGLGYNRRAVRLQEAAQQIEAEGWPSEIEGLRSLPGVGRYTAAAVAAFAFGHREPAVDTNLRRVLSRWQGAALEGRSLVEAARRSLDDDAAAWNQAVMDLGATLCHQRDPECSHCPVAAWCADPTVTPPLRRQSRFEGSRRQARGAALRTLITRGSATLAEIVADTGISDPRLTEALDALEREGMLEREADRYRISPGSSPAGVSPRPS